GCRRRTDGEDAKPALRWDGELPRDQGVRTSRNSGTETGASRMSLRSYGSRRKYLDRGRQCRQSNLQRIETVARRLHRRPVSLPAISRSLKTEVIEAACCFSRGAAKESSAAPRLRNKSSSVLGLAKVC